MPDNTLPGVPDNTLPGVPDNELPEVGIPDNELPGVPCEDFKEDCEACAAAGYCVFSPDVDKDGSCLPNCDEVPADGACFSPPNFDDATCKELSTDCEKDFDTCMGCLGSGFCAYSPDTGKDGSCLASCDDAVADGRCFEKGSGDDVCAMLDTEEPTESPTDAPTIFVEVRRLRSLRKNYHHNYFFAWAPNSQHHHFLSFCYRHSRPYLPHRNRRRLCRPPSPPSPLHRSRAIPFRFRSQRRCLSVTSQRLSKWNQHHSQRLSKWNQPSFLPPNRHMLPS